VERWILVAVWVTLPFTAGSAGADALDGWSTAPQVVAAVVLWGAWAAGLLAVIVPRPVGLTVIRAVAPLFATAAIVAVLATDVDATAAVAAVIATLAASVLAARPALAFAAANAVSYGDESRYPLHVPPALFLAPLPLARLALGAAVTAGPLLLADERWVLGTLALVVGVPLAVATSRVLHGLSERFVVLVPAGFVVVDPYTLSDPVLCVRERIVSLRAAGPAPTPRPELVDLRLGASIGTVAVTIDAPAELFRTGRTRRSTVTTRADELWIAPLRRRALLLEAAQRRIPVVADSGAAGRPVGQAATPPPRSTSPS
jgi:hypothetical protein